MGQFSWLDCVDGSQIVDDKMVDVFVLVPKEFGGGHIKEPFYDGYGHFGGFDIFDLVAEWNRKELTHQMLMPLDPTKWGKDDTPYYEWAVERHLASLRRMMDFKSGSIPDDEMEAMHGGEDFKRLIGIDIACYDKQNFSLPYPIKITHDPSAVYEKCEPSKSDPDQGWETYDDDDEEY